MIIPYRSSREFAAVLEDARDNIDFQKKSADFVFSVARGLAQSGLGWNETNKIFISDLAYALNLPVSRLAGRLLVWNNLGLIELTRADLTSAMDDNKLSASEIGLSYDGARYHFVVAHPPQLRGLEDSKFNAAFWRWFGNSVIRHDDGTPKIVYHGTRSPIDFEIFQTGSVFDEEEEDELLIGGSIDPSAFLGPHFTESLKLAQKFASGTAQSWDKKRYVKNEGKGRVIPVYLRIENPKIFTSDEEIWKFIWTYGESHEIDDLFELHEIEEISPNVWYDAEKDEQYTTAEINERLFYETLDESDFGHSPREIAAEEFGTSARDVLIKQGFDGIVYLNTVEGGGNSYVVFETTQIKSADRNSGAWDRSNPSILQGIAWDDAYGQIPAYAANYRRIRIPTSQIVSPFINPTTDARIEELAELESAGYNLPPIIVNGPFEVEQVDYPEEKYPFLDGHHPTVGEEFWYVHDGHHRVLLALQNNKRFVDALLME